MRDQIHISAKQVAITFYKATEGLWSSFVWSFSMWIYFYPTPKSIVLYT